jgi:EAL domain-containing protein (putative c-di-GMP-specific phosphodiesterase class I)
VTTVPGLRELQGRLGPLLREQGGLGCVLIDLEHLARIERSFGGATYESLRSHIDQHLAEMKDRFRQGDLLARDERGGDRYVLFLAGRRDGSATLSMPELRKLADRVEEFLNPRIARLSLPYLRERPAVDVGYAFAIWSPLESDERQVQRLMEDAAQAAELRQRVRERDQREGLLDIIYNRRVWTAFHAIVEMDSRKIVGFEGLSRGPRGTELEPPVQLFGLAARHGLVEELERACRRQIFSDWEYFGGEGRLFVNTVPATVRDTSFQGRGVLDYLGPKLSPRFVTLEITEGQVIENLNLYREAMHAFLDLGFTFAIDDVGAGYSGLETIANLGASYLKIDMGLVRDVHLKRATQQVVKAILDVGAGVGATVIAEGVQTQEEVDTLRELGVRYAQGYFYARPVDPYAPKTPVVVKNA